MLWEHIGRKLRWIAIIIVWGIAPSVPAQQDSLQEQLLTGQLLLERAYREGGVPVIIKLRLPAYAPEGALSSAAVADQRADIGQTQTHILAQLSGYGVAEVKQYKILPLLALRLDGVGLRAALADPNVEAVYEDVQVWPTLAESAPLIGAPAAWDQGFAGAGQVVAILDTGVDKNHPFLTGKVVNEACFSTTNSSYNTRTVCPNGQSSQTGAGAGVPCQADGCKHGAHVAGIATGRGGAFSGVARDAGIIAVQIFSAVYDPAGCRSAGYNSPCVNAFFSDIALGLEHVYTQRTRFNIAAVNMSLGGGRYSGYCDANTPLKPAIDLLRSAGVATVIASGNGGFKDSISAPACISSAISVGATSKQDSVANFSNSAPILNLLAPGVSINSSVPGNSFERFNGTSMAAPHVAGAFAVLRSKAPTASVDTLLNALQNTGVIITDSANGLRKPRIKVDAALNALDSGGAGSLRVAPATGLSASGPAGGPFNPASQTYQLTNAGSTAIHFEVNASAAWASVSPTGGSLEPGASASVVVAITASANSLPAGDYTSAVNFINAVNNVGNTSRALTLSITEPANSNDKFENALLLSGGGGSTTGSNSGAAKENGEPNHAGLPGGRSVWWRWAAPLTGEVTFDTFGSDFDTLLGAYTGSNVAALTVIAGNDDDGASRQSRIRFRTAANTVYYIAVDGYNGATGAIVLNWQFTPDAAPPGGIAVSPQDNYSAAGPQGGPFQPASMTYTLTNVSAAAASFTVRDVPSWLTVSSTGGVLPSGGSAQITLSINAAANALQPGQHAATVLFNAIARTATLRVGSAGNITNDNFASATVLTGPAAQATASNVGASKEPDEPNHAGASGGHSVWWRWTASAAGPVTIDTLGSNFDTVLGVYTGAQVAALTEAASNDDAGGLQSRASFRAAAGVTYYIAVDGYGGAAGDIVLNLAMTTAGGPSNDDFANATVLQGVTATVTGGNRDADKEPGEPNHAGSNGGHSVWWRWTAPAAGVVTIDTFGSSFDTLLGVYRGAQVSALTPIASNDDAAGRQSRVSFQAVAGAVYYIAVDGWNGGVGDIVLNLSLTVTSGNDDFINGFPVQGTKATVNGGNQNATKEAGEPDHAGASGGRSVWWRWTAPAAGTVVLDTFGSNFDTLLGVYTGVQVTALTTVASNDDAGGGGTTQSRASFQVVAGATYSIAVDGYNGAVGAIVLNLELTPSQQPANDLFANAAHAQGVNTTVNGGNQNAAKEEGEPDHAGDHGGHSIWWKWTAPAVGRVFVDTFGSNFDTLLGVYQGSQVAELIEIASNDNTGGRQSQASFRTTAGMVYYIAVDGWGGGVGNVVLHLAFSENYTLTVYRAGPGAVSSNPAGVNCGGDCQEDYPSGAVVTLTARPNSNAVFAGWGGACSGANPTCRVTMSQARSVTAVFNQKITYSLKVAKRGNGGGVVSSSPSGVNCGSDCSESYASGKVVKLTAKAKSDSTFAGWSGACGGSASTCTVTMSQAKTVTAAFVKKGYYLLTVTKAGNGGGSVTSSPTGIDCGSDCNHSYRSGVKVKLAAKAASGSVFAGWSSSCSGRSLTCQVTMGKARAVKATFNRRSATSGYDWQELLLPEKEIEFLPRWNGQ